MSELSLYIWKIAKKANLINSVPAGTPVFVYGKSTNNVGEYGENDEANEFFVKRMLGLDEEE